MKIVVASAFLSVFAVAAIGQQQNQPAPPPPPPAAPGSPTGQATTPANQGVPVNASGRSAFGQPDMNQTPGAGNAPLFLNVSPTMITDANGQPLGVLQQLVLTPSGNVNFGLVNIGGRLVPVPWQLIVTGNAGRSGLAVNADRQLLQRAPAFATVQVPMLTQDDIQQQILAHFALQAAAAPQPTVVTTGTARGGTGGAGVTLTGGATNTIPFSTNTTATSTNTASITASNQALNTTSGLLSPTGRTNAAYDGYNSRPATPPTNTAPPNNPAPNTSGQRSGQR